MIMRDYNLSLKTKKCLCINGDLRNEIVTYFELFHCFVVSVLNRFSINFSLKISKFLQKDYSVSPLNKNIRRMAASFAISSYHALVY